jgi:hypothetical protein
VIDHPTNPMPQVKTKENRRPINSWLLFICGAALLGVLVPVTLAGDGSFLPLAKFPPRTQLLAFLAQNIDWYRSFSVEQHIATDPTDLLFLEDNRSIGRQVVRLSFDFARFALAYAAESPTSQGGPTSASGPVFQNLVAVQAKSEAAAQSADKNMQLLQRQRMSARGANRDRLDIEIADAQGQVRALQSMSTTLRSLREFIRATDAGETDATDLAALVDGLEQTVPDLSPTAAGSATILRAQDSGGSATSAPTEPGILGKIARVSALAQKRRTVDEANRQTEQLAQASQSLLTPLAAELNLAFQNPDLLAMPSESDNVAALQQQQNRLNALISETGKVSPAITALAKQKVLLTLYESHLGSWRISIVRQYRSAWKDVVLRVFALCAAIILAVAVSAFVRRITSLHVHDANSRHMILIGQRIMLWLSIALIVAFAFAFDLRSLATFLGIASAGLAVAMQNVILAVIGYFFLVGKLHLRVGDLVEISGVRGEVTEIGLLQFRLRELGEPRELPTGRVVSFSNSFIFVSPATGLFKRSDIPQERSVTTNSSR